MLPGHQYNHSENCEGDLHGSVEGLQTMIIDHCPGENVFRDCSLCLCEVVAEQLPEEERVSFSSIVTISNSLNISMIVIVINLCDFNSSSSSPAFTLPILPRSPLMPPPSWGEHTSVISEALNRENRLECFQQWIRI